MNQGFISDRSGQKHHFYVPAPGFHTNLFSLEQTKRSINYVLFVLLCLEPNEINKNTFLHGFSCHRLVFENPVEPHTGMGK